MAMYKHSQFLAVSQDQAFDTPLSPGTTNVNSGIYRCEGCGHEVASNKGDPLPPQNHHQHNAQQGAIRWRLVVFAQGR